MFGFGKNKSKNNKVVLYKYHNRVAEKYCPDHTEYAIERKYYDHVAALGIDLKEMIAEIRKQTVLDLSDPKYMAFAKIINDEDPELIKSVNGWRSTEMFATRIGVTLNNYTEDGKFKPESERKKIADAFMAENKPINGKEDIFANRMYDMDIHGLITSMLISSFSHEMISPICNELAERYRELRDKKLADPNVFKTFAECEKYAKTHDVFDSIDKHAATETLVDVDQLFFTYDVFGRFCPDLKEQMKFFFALRKKWDLHDGKPEHDPIIGEMDKILNNKITAKEMCDNHAKLCLGLDRFEDYWNDAGVSTASVVGRHLAAYTSYCNDWNFGDDVDIDMDEILNNMIWQYIYGLKKYYLLNMYGINKDIVYTGEEEPSFDLRLSLEANTGLAIETFSNRYFLLVEKSDKLNESSTKVNIQWERDQGFSGEIGKARVNLTFKTPITEVRKALAENVDIDVCINYYNRARGGQSWTALGCAAQFFISFYTIMYTLAMDGSVWAHCAHSMVSPSYGRDLFG